VAVTAGDAVVGHAGLNVAEGDPALAVFTGGTGLGPERLAVVSRLFVVAEAQRCGVATALLTAAASVAHAAGKRPVLDVLEADLGAITFYERAGWVRTGSILFRSPRTGQPLPAFVYAGPPPPSGRC
jgi:GNAT superfamily N-acetyltransferase